MGHPTHHADLTPCGFFLWGWMKHRIYANPITNRAYLHQRIEDAFTSLPQCMVERAIQAYKERLVCCISVGRGSVERAQLIED